MSLTSQSALFEWIRKNRKPLEYGLLVGACVFLSYFWFGKRLIARVPESGAARIAEQVLAAVGFYSVLLASAGGFYFAHSKLQESVIKSSIIFSCLFLVAVVIRFPFFFPSVIDGDESAFIMMGQDILNGHLPYTHLWDVKPPLLFVFFALLLLVSKSIVAVRLGGLLAVIFCAYVVYKIGNRIYGRTAGFWGSLIVLVFASTFSSGQATMGEHVLLIPLSGLLFFVLREKYTRFDIFLIGLFVALSILVRTNVVYLVPGVLLIVFLNSRKHNAHLLFGNIITLIFGMAVPFLILALIYYLDNSLPILVQSLILAPAALPHVEAVGLFSQVWALISLVWDSMSGPNVLIWLAPFVGLVVLFRQHARRRSTLILTGLCFFMLLSIMAMSAAHSHYLIHLVPFLALIGGVGLTVLLGGRYRYHFSILVLMCLLIPLRPVAAEYLAIWHKVDQKKSLQSDAGYQVADYLKKNKAAGQYMFVCNGPPHIVYWLAGAKSATKYSDPSYLNYESLLKTLGNESTTKESELRDILQNNPLFIVKEGDCFEDEGRSQILSAEILRNYRLDTRIEAVDVYKNLELKNESGD